MLTATYFFVVVISTILVFVGCADFEVVGEYLERAAGRETNDVNMSRKLAGSMVVLGCIGFFIAGSL